MAGRHPPSRTIYVGNLPGDVRDREIEDIFYKYGRIVDIDLKILSRPPGYAFVEFEDPRDAEDAIRGRDGYEFDGYRLRVEFAHGGRAAASSYGGQRSGPPRTGGISRRTEYRVIVKGLPASASWQDLKDHMRQGGDVCFAQVFKDGSSMMGVVDYTNEDDMKYACRKLDDSEFQNPYARGSFIRVYQEKDYKERERSYSRSPERRRSYSRSRSRSRSTSPKRRRKDDDDSDDDKGARRKARDTPEKDRDQDEDGRDDKDRAKDERNDRDDSEDRVKADSEDRDLKEEDKGIDKDDKRIDDED